MAPIDFYHFSLSGPSRKALLTVRNLGLDVNLKILNLLEKEQLKPEFLKINPDHCVPTINDNGFILWESRVICSYLVDSTSPNHSLYPKDPKQRAIIDQRIYFDAITFHPSMRAICFPAIFLGESKISDEKRKNLNDAMEKLNTYLKDSKWVASNDKVTIADLIILATVSSLTHSGATLDKYPNIAVWYEQCKTLPGFEENEEGSRLYGERVKANLKDKF